MSTSTADVNVHYTIFLVVPFMLIDLIENVIFTLANKLTFGLFLFFFDLLPNIIVSFSPRL
jgi:hypothetical protein